MIRLATAADAPGISRLLNQLEYPGTEAFLAARLQSMLTDPAEMLLVWAEPPAGVAATPRAADPAMAAPTTEPPTADPAMAATPRAAGSSSPAIPPAAGAPTGSILALLSLHFIPQIALKGDFARISYFAVDEQARSRGIGRELEAEATRLARERGCVLLEVHCHTRRTRAHEFYYRQGYEESPKYLIKRL
ncbi:GNAT family N-acetyltransferase [Puia sp.]|jgi:GNAT superfamily N-acetyltransferase|uniref:GNAT family N-acetyltransferase n=1 Tax=Puia sp. TaxID=2045100 RepID=UPI002F429877